MIRFTFTLLVCVQNVFIGYDRKLTTCFSSAVTLATKCSMSSRKYNQAASYNILISIDLAVFFLVFPFQRKSNKLYQYIISYFLLFSILNNLLKNSLYFHIVSLYQVDYNFVFLSASRYTYQSSFK